MFKLKYLFVLIFILLIIVVLYCGGRFVWAEFHFRLSLKSSSPQDIYQSQQKAIKIAPIIDYYHRHFSQTSLALADSQIKEGTPSAEQKKTVAVLITQAIEEAKTAVSLSSNAQNLENLGLIYKNLIGIAPKAEEYSLAALRLAVSHDPKNPRLQLEIAGIYFLLKDYHQARKFYNNALILKPNYGLAQYGLALVEKESGNLKRATEYFQLALKNTPHGSPDYQKIKAGLEFILSK